MDPCDFCHLTPKECGHQGAGCYVMAPDMPDDHELEEVDEECRPVTSNMSNKSHGTLTA